ncbi:MAG: NAD(P)H-dependent glycerol-3-phosphate dehydrogenase [Pseudomonadota bacterium]
MSSAKWREPEGLAVVGAGSWGSALAIHLARKGLKVKLWVYEKEVCEQIEQYKENKTYLKDIHFPDNVVPSNELEEVVRGQSVVLMVVPSHITRTIVGKMAGFLSPGVIICSATKGMENESLMTMSQVMADVLPAGLAYSPACLAGPSFAREVGVGLPSAVTLACPNCDAGERLREFFSSPLMRVYSSQDLMGVELGGALKNVFAIGAGISDGLGLGTSARAALITRGLAEMSRLGVHLGANPLTFMGLAGVGDLVLTCTGDLSRNRTVGLKLGKGFKLKDILNEMKMVAEGVKTTRSVHDLAGKENVDMPLTEQVYRVIYEDKDPRQGLMDLMTRSLKDEIDHHLMV